MIRRVLGFRYWVLAGVEYSFYCKSIFRALYFKPTYIGGET